METPFSAFGRHTSPVWRVGGCVCRVWSAYVPGMAGWRVRMPRLVGIRPRYGGLEGAYAAFGRHTHPVRPGTDQAPDPLEVEGVTPAGPPGPPRSIPPAGAPGPPAPIPVSYTHLTLPTIYS